MSNPDLIEWVAKKAIDSVNGNPRRKEMFWLSRWMRRATAM